MHPLFVGYAYLVTSEQPKRRGRPVTTGTTPSRHVRIGAIWDQAKTVAEQRDETVSAVVVRALTRYVEENTN